MATSVKYSPPISDIIVVFQRAAQQTGMVKYSFLIKRPLFRYLGAIVVVGIATLFDLPFHTRISPTNLVMFYLLAVVIAAVFLGRGPAILTSTLGVLAFDFLFVPPFYTLRVDDTEYLITFAGFLLISILISELTVRVQEQSERVRRSQVIEETERLQAALLNSISHDLRTPLVSITGSLSTLKEKLITLDDELRINLIENAYEEAERLNRFVSNMLNMSRLEAGAMRIRKHPEDIQDVVGSALEQLDKQIGSRTIQVAYAPGLSLIQMDFVLIVQVLVNLIDNAMKYSPGNTPIDIEAHCSEMYLEIRISDRGIGIPAGDLQKVFDKFYRIQRPNNVSGTGLGLSICKGIVEAHKGWIRAENRTGGGTTITLALPLEGAEGR